MTGRRRPRLRSQPRFRRKRLGRRLLLCVLRSAFEGLAAFGGLCLYAPTLLPAEWAAEQLSGYAADRKPGQLTGPAERHPERLRPDVPLNSSERWFRLQMQHLDPLLPADNS